MRNIKKGQVFIVKQEANNVNMFIGESYRVVSVKRDTVKMVIIGKQNRGNYGLTINPKILDQYFTPSTFQDDFKPIKKGQLAYPKADIMIEADGQSFLFEADKPYLIINGGNTVSIYHSPKTTLKVADTTLYNDFHIAERKPKYENGITVKSKKIGSLKCIHIMYHGKTLINANVSTYTNNFEVTALNTVLLKEYREQIESGYYQSPFGNLDDEAFAKRMVGFEYFNFNGFTTFKEYVDIRAGKY